MFILKKILTGKDKLYHHTSAGISTSKHEEGNIHTLVGVANACLFFKYLLGCENLQLENFQISHDQSTEQR